MPKPTVEQKRAGLARGGYSPEMIEKMAPLPLREGYTRHPLPEPRRASARELGGAEDDPSIEISVGPSGEITRRRRKD